MGYDSTMPRRPSLFLLAPPLILVVLLAWSCGCCVERTTNEPAAVDTGEPQC